MENQLTESAAATKALNEIITNEIQINNLIIEKQGVAACNYRDILRKIVDYCKAFLKKHQSNNKQWLIEIPENYTKEFGFFKKLDIIIKIFDVNGLADKYSGGGATYIRPFEETPIENGMFLEPQKIEIEGYSNRDELYEASLYNSLYHELNHKMEELRWNRTKAVNSTKYIFNQVKDLEKLRSVPIFQDEEINKLFQTIIYRLFSTTEVNALAAGVFGDLEGMHSERGHFKTDIKKTQAWYLYSWIKGSIPALEYMPLKGYEIIKSRLENTAMSFGKPNIPIETYKKRFITIVKERLKDLYQRIGKVASYYYDVHEDEMLTEFKINFRRFAETDKGDFYFI